MRVSEIQCADTQHFTIERAFRLTDTFVREPMGLVSIYQASVSNLGRLSKKTGTFEKKVNAMRPFRYKISFWVLLSVGVFSILRWLTGIALPDAANAFAIGATGVLIGGLITGFSLTRLALREEAIRNTTSTITIEVIFVLVGLVVIAFLMNSMVGKTTFFPFAMTVLLLFLVMAAIASLITIVRHQVRRQITSAHAAVAQSKSELQLLQSQLSPHFLFNTLNNLYGLSMSEPARIPALLLKLSDLLRYSVYEAKELFVPLDQEMNYIRNYVDFERLRLGERLQLKLDLASTSELNCNVPPLLLIVFVENAFKHSRAAGDQPIAIEIRLVKKENHLVFYVLNSVTRHQVKPSLEAFTTEKYSGFGLDSVRKRLNLLYPDKHRLKIEQGEDHHSVLLSMECQ